MGKIQIVADGLVDAPAERVYGILADYERHHPKILPPAFSDFAVEEGGVGEGTVMHFTMKSGGRTRTFHQRVTEPDRGHILRESGTDSSEVTTFTVTPEGEGSRVRIETILEASGGIMGFLERTFAPRVIRGIFLDELARLNHYAQEQGR
jgi:carbon monoxide dehydrogenase subunit G